MELIISKNAKQNYLTKIVDIDAFHPHPDKEVNKLKCTYVDGYNIIVGIDSEPGKYAYFPTSSQINPDLLRFANLYRHGSLNSDPNQTGMFEDNGRVKAIRLRGCVSEGFLLPVNVLKDWILDSVNIDISDLLIANTEFDTFVHNGKNFWISKKYVIKSGNVCTKGNNIKKFHGDSRVIDSQFHKHYDTIIYRKEPNAICPEDIIHISSKWDGTSQISAFVLCNTKLNLKQKIAKWLTGYEFNQYDYLVSSRNVVLNADFESKAFYGAGDYSSRMAAHEIIKPHLTKGMTVYYEIVGYTNEGKPWIKRGGKDMDYGCVPSTTEYIEGKNYKIYIYRITLTNVDGVVHEFSPLEVQTWCKNHDLRACEQFYYGPAGDLYPDLYQTINSEDRLYVEDWNMQFIEHLANDKNFYMEEYSPDCVNKVPHEGIVLKKDDMVSRAWKLKTFMHLNSEQADLDKGESNIEDES